MRPEFLRNDLPTMNDPCPHTPGITVHREMDGAVLLVYGHIKLEGVNQTPHLIGIIWDDKGDQLLYATMGNCYVGTYTNLSDAVRNIAVAYYG